MTDDAYIIATTRPARLNRHNISDEELEKLATLRRSKWNEFTWAALTGLIAAAPAALDALYHAFLVKFNAHPLDVIGTVYVAAMTAFLTLFLFSIIFPNDRQGSASTLLAKIRARNKTISKNGGSGGANNATIGTL